jgi:hypothetical protein
MKRFARTAVIVCLFGTCATAMACAKLDESPAIGAEPLDMAGEASIASTAEACNQVGGIEAFKVINDLDDDCGIWVNGTYRGPLPQTSETDWIPAGANSRARTNILIRCQDGGVYATSVEAVHQACVFRLDEEGGGLHTVECH